jgi:hypothetical protein
MECFLQEGAFALAFKSRHFPGQLVATRRGSPLLVGIKSESRLATDHFPVFFSKGILFLLVFAIISTTKISDAILKSGHDHLKKVGVASFLSLFFTQMERNMIE